MLLYPPLRLFCFGLRSFPMDIKRLRNGQSATATAKPTTAPAN
jgi:hypothetical protein